MPSFKTQLFSVYEYRHSPTCTYSKVCQMKPDFFFISDDEGYVKFENSQKILNLLFRNWFMITVNPAIYKCYIYNISTHFNWNKVINDVVTLAEEDADEDGDVGGDGDDACAGDELHPRGKHLNPSQFISGKFLMVQFLFIVF